MAKQKIIVEGTEVRIKRHGDEDFISITDVAKRSSNREPSTLIQSWLRNQNTLLFLETWEEVHNEDFKPSQMARFRLSATENRNNITAKKYIEETGAMGIISKSGRYGGTYAHSDIALNFCYWLNPQFQVYLLKEFQRLKAQEVKSLEDTKWDIRRELTKRNYHIHTDAVREKLVPILEWNTKREGIYFASEADLLNMAVFGMTASEWRAANPKKKGNIRDSATHAELEVLANLESNNATLIEMDYNQVERLSILSKRAERELDIIKSLELKKQIKKSLPKGKDK